MRYVPIVNSKMRAWKIHQTTCPCERNFAQIARRFQTSFRFALNIVAHNMEGKSKNLKYSQVQIFSQIFEILMIQSIQFFIFISKILMFLKLDQNWHF